MTRQWFDTKACTELEIKKFKSGVALQIGNAVTIEDNMVVKNIMQRIENIPAMGDMIISFAPGVEII